MLEPQIDLLKGSWQIQQDVSFLCFWLDRQENCCSLKKLQELSKLILKTCKKYCTTHRSIVRPNVELLGWHNLPTAAQTCNMYLKHLYFVGVFGLPNDKQKCNYLKNEYYEQKEQVQNSHQKNFGSFWKKKK